MRSPLPKPHLRTLLLATLLGCNLLPISAHAGLQEGAMAYVAGDQATALREFEPLALQGVREAIKGVSYLVDDGYIGALYVLGAVFESGNFGNADIVEAYKWYSKGADKGDARAQYALGRLVETGKHGSADVEDAYRLYSKAADQGHAEASAAQKRLAPTVAAIEKMRAQEAAAAIKREQQRLALWRKKLQIGDDTHCGPIIEVRRPMFKVALIAQIQGFGSESWLKEAELYTPEYGCRNVNGRLSTQ